MKLNVTEADGQLLVDAIREALNRKQEAMRLVNEQLAEQGTEQRFHSSDFGIPRLEALLAQLQGEG